MECCFPVQPFLHVHLRVHFGSYTMATYQRQNSDKMCCSVFVVILTMIRLVAQMSYLVQILSTVSMVSIYTVSQGLTILWNTPFDSLNL